MNFHYPIVISTPLKWCLNFLSNNSSFRKNHGREGNTVRNEQKKLEDQEGEPCAVCLCSIAEGDDVKELRCDHLFHRVCLERWFGYGRVTCPVCRYSIKSCTKKAEFGENVIFFSFSSSSRSSNHKSSWWLR